MNRRKLIIVISEGQSEENALYPVLKSFFSPDEVIFYIYNGDLTVRKYSSSPVSEIESIVRTTLRRYALKRSDIRAVVELTDTDGCFISNEDIIYDDECKHIRYSDDGIRTMFPESIIDRNAKRRENLAKLIECSALGGRIPFAVIYFSRNLEHAVYGIDGHVSDNRKTDLAFSFSDRFGYNHKAFIEYLEGEKITPEGGYLESWNAIMEGSESLKRHSNLLLLFTPEQLS